jgi:hypothetical protein
MQNCFAANEWTKKLGTESSRFPHLPMPLLDKRSFHAIRLLAIAMFYIPNVLRLVRDVGAEPDHVATRVEVKRALGGGGVRNDMIIPRRMRS